MTTRQYTEQNRPARWHNMAGFTLLELMVVLVVIGIMLGLVSLSVIPDKQQALLKDAQRVALLLQLARDEAIVRNRQVAFEIDADKYSFYVRGDKDWEPITDSDLFRERAFSESPLEITRRPSLKSDKLPMKIIFGREPVDKPFVLTLEYEGDQVSIHADGVGHFTVE